MTKSKTNQICIKQKYQKDGKVIWCEGFYTPNGLNLDFIKNHILMIKNGWTSDEMIFENKDTAPTPELTDQEED